MGGLMGGMEQTDLSAAAMGADMFRLMADHAPAMMWVADAAGRVASFNRAWYEFTGRTPEQDEGDGWTELLHPEDREAVERQWRETVIRGEPCLGEYRLRRADGEYRWLLDDGRPILDERGRLRGFVGSCRDITERRAAADALRASAATLREVAGAVPGVLYQYEVGSDGARRYSYVSEGVRGLLGVSPEYVLADGMSLYNMVNPAQLPAMRREGEAALRECRPSVHDVEMRLPDGRVRQVRIRASPRIERDGSRVWTGLIIDVSEERRIAAALARSEERAQLALETAADGLWEWNVQTGAVYIAPKNMEMLGYEPGEMEIRTIEQWRELYHPEDWPEAARRQAEHFEGLTRVYEYNRRLRHKLGHYVWVQTRGRVVQRGPSGEPIRMLGTNLDLTARREQERALRESEERFRSAYEHAPVGVVILDADANILRANPALCTMTGYTEDELIALGFDGLTHPDDQEINKTPRADLLAGRVSAVQYEKRYIHKSGREIWVLACVSVIRDGTGALNSYVGQILDITAQKLVLTERAETEARWRAVLESALDCIVTMDEEGRIVDFNSAAERAFGRTRDQVRDLPVAQVLIPGRLREGYLQRLEAIKRGGGASPVDRRVEMVGLRADGAEFPLELAVVPTHLPSGRIMFTAYIRDISARKSSEEALRSSTERFTALSDMAPVGIYLTDAAGNCTYVNPRWLETSGLTFEQATGRGWSETIHPEDRERVIAEWYAAASAGKNYSGEFRFVTPNGRLSWVYVAARPLRAEGGSISGYLGTVTDVTELKKAEARARQSLAQREELLYREAALRRELDHRVRNNLAALLGLVGLYERSGKSDGSVSEALRGKLLAMREVHEVIARSPGSPVGLASLIERLAAQLLNTVQARAVAIRGPALHIPSPQAGAMAMILQEFFTNARKHGCMRAAGGAIAVQWETEPAADHTCVRLVWSESGGPPAPAPPAFGVGLHLVEGFAAAELRGGIEFRFSDTGFSCILRAKFAGPSAVAGFAEDPGPAPRG